MYPPDALVRFSKRLHMLSARPGKERLFRGLAVSGLVVIPTLAACAVAAYALLDAAPDRAWLVWLSGASLLIAVSLSCSQWAVLTEEGRPLLSAWLRVASSGAWLLMAFAYCLAAYLWLGWVASAALGILVIVAIAVAVFKGGSRAAG